MGLRKIYSILGPGLLYAGSAIGVSHLVKSTRAGADFFFDLVWILILVNIIKYPFFEFSARYVKATGFNLIEGYGKSGRWAVVLFAGQLLAFMNFKVVTHSHVPLDYRPGKAMRINAWTGIRLPECFCLVLYAMEPLYEPLLIRDDDFKANPF